MGRILSTRERSEKDFSTPLAGFDSNKKETGPTRTGMVSTPSCIEKWEYKGKKVIIVTRIKKKGAC